MTDRYSPPSHSAVSRVSRRAKPEMLRLWQDCGMEELPYGPLSSIPWGEVASMEFCQLSSADLTRLTLVEPRIWKSHVPINIDEHHCSKELTVSPVRYSSCLQSDGLAQLGTETFHSLPCLHILLHRELQRHQVNQRYKNLWNPEQHWIFGMTSWLYMGTNKRQRFPEAAGYKV